MIITLAKTKKKCNNSTKRKLMALPLFLFFFSMKIKVFLFYGIQYVCDGIKYTPQS